jgi:hypothetical protein
MRFARQILVVAILALYVAQVVGGRAVHLGQHLAGSGSCCGEAHCRTASTHSRQHDHPHGYCHRHGENGDDEQQQDGHSPGKNRQHDSSTCWVCQILGQAQDKPLDLETTVFLAVSPVTVVVLPDFYPSTGRSGFQSRAPPAVQA